MNRMVTDLHLVESPVTNSLTLYTGQFVTTQNPLSIFPRSGIWMNLFFKGPCNSTVTAFGHTVKVATTRATLCVTFASTILCCISVD